MDYQQFFIPKQNDLSIILALIAIQKDFEGIGKFVIRVAPHQGAEPVDLPNPEPEKSPLIDYVLSENSEIIPHFYLLDAERGQKQAIAIHRKPEGIADTASVDWGSWGQALPASARSQMYVKLRASARKHLRATDMAADLSGTGEKEWGRYRDSQQAVLKSLEGTLTTVVVDFNRRCLEAETAARTKYEKLESALEEKLQALEENLSTEHARKLKAITDREAAADQREKSFNTKEARYVARQQQDDQIKQIEKWLEGWSFPKGTSRKRWTVIGAYAVAMLVTIGLTVWFSAQSLEILKGKDFSQVTWWQWTLLSIKSILPLAAFTTFVVYFIRWTSTWAYQHADEDFRNRSRVVDIRRSAWLLEAVRDAQDNNRELPTDLLKELSRNLFTQNHSPERGDVDPQAISDVLMQGLESIRVKSPSGAEVEAKRGGKK